MDITYAHRQRLIRETKPIKEIIELYPALSITDFVSTGKCIFPPRLISQ
jgi:hypothetical protein